MLNQATPRLVVGHGIVQTQAVLNFKEWQQALKRGVQLVTPGELSLSQSLAIHLLPSN
jgi:hypothetical protein